MISKFRKDDYKDGGDRGGDRGGYQSGDRMPAFQLNKFQSEFNLSFNREMAKIITGALLRNEELMQTRGKNVPTCLFALLSKLEDAQKPRNYDNHYHDEYEHNHHDEQENSSYEYH